MLMLRWLAEMCVHQSHSYPHSSDLIPWTGEEYPYAVYSSSSSILPALTSLDISGNFITNFSILSISDTLNGLQSLNVSGNRPSRDSFIVFCSKQVLYSNTYICINVDLYSLSYALHVMILFRN